MANFVYLSGRLSNEPIINTSASGKIYGKFSLAVTDDYKNNSGERGCQFLTCMCFGAATKILENYSKGMFLGVSGKLQNSNYTDSKGVKHYSSQVLVSSFDLIPNNKKFEFAEHDKSDGFDTFAGPGNNDFDSFPVFE